MSKPHQTANQSNVDLGYWTYFIGLADRQRSVNFTYVFGGSNGNEGLGLLSICFDWQYIAGSYNPMTIPLQAQVRI